MTNCSNSRQNRTERTCTKSAIEQHRTLAGQTRANGGVVPVDRGLSGLSARRRSRSDAGDAAWQSAALLSFSCSVAALSAIWTCLGHVLPGGLLGRGRVDSIHVGSSKKRHTGAVWSHFQHMVRRRRECNKCFIFARDGCDSLGQTLLRETSGAASQWNCHQKGGPYSPLLRTPFLPPGSPPLKSQGNPMKTALNDVRRRILSIESGCSAAQRAPQEAALSSRAAARAARRSSTRRVSAYRLVV